MANILVIGAGVMGTAITIPAVDNGHKAKIIGTPLDQELINNIKEKSYHPKLDIYLKDTIGKQHNEMTQEDCDQSDLIIIGVSSKGMDWLINFIKKFNFLNKKFLIVTKGLFINDKNEFDIFPNRILKEVDQDINISAVTGPCKALELANKNITNICFVNENLDVAINLSKLFQNNYYFIESNNDLIGSEASAALKNIYAIILGYSQVYYFNKQKIFNPESALFSHCIKEMSSFVTSVGGDRETVFGLSGLGDLHVTSGTGRNGALGKYLAKNNIYSQIINNELKDETVEGSEMLIDLEKHFKKHLSKNKFPILESLLRCICNDEKLDIPWRDLNI